jgi:tetratricopeptide (TPR) repeat protein
MAAPPGAGLPWWAIAAALAGSLAAYLPALRGPFLFDDLALPVFRPEGPLGWLHYARSVRPLYYLSLLADYTIWGAGDPLPYHAVNWLLHAANSALVFYILRKVLEHAGRERRASLFTAAAGAGLYLLHPLQTEAVSYIASRSEGLSVLFAYAALAVFLAGGAAAVSYGRAAAILLLLALGLAAKEHVVAAAGAILLLDLFLFRSLSPKALAVNWRLYAPMLAGAAAGGAYVFRLASGGTAGFSVEGVKWYEYLFTQFKAVWLYVRFFVLPVGQNLDHGMRFSRSIAEPAVLLGAAALAGALAACWVYRNRFPLAVLGFLMFLALLAPTSSVVPIADAFAERRLYLPMIGLLLICAEFLSRRAPDRRLISSAVCVLLLCGALTWKRNAVYASTIAMWEDSVRGNPHNARAQFQLAHAYYLAGRCREADYGFTRTAQLQKPTYELYVDWALALDCDNRPEEALEKLQSAAKLEASAHVYSQIAMILAKNRRYGEALEAVEKSLAKDPNYEPSLVYRGNIRLLTGDAAGAAEDFKRVLGMNPSNEQARQGLAAAARPR